MSGSSRPELTSTAPSPSLAAPPLIDAVFVRLLLIQVSIGFGFSLFFLLPKYLATELHAEASGIGAFSAAGLLAPVLVTPLLGWALDRFGRRRCLQLGALLVMLTSLALLFTHTLDALLYTERVLQGIGFALGFNACAASVADRAPAERLSKAMGLLGVSSLATNAIAPALGEYIAVTYGWSSVFALAALASVATFALAARVTDAARTAAAHAGQTRAASDTPVWLAAAINGAAFGTLITFSQAFALEQGATRVAGFYLGYTVGALFIRLLFGDAADRWGRRRVAQLALFGYGAVVLASSTLRPNLLELFGLGFGIFHGFLYPALAALVAAEARPDRRGRQLTRFTAAFNGGAGCALFAGGWLAKAQGYPCVFLLVGAATLATALTLRARPERAVLE